MGITQRARRYKYYDIGELHFESFNFYLYVERNLLLFVIDIFFSFELLFVFFYVYFFLQFYTFAREQKNVNYLVGLTLTIREKLK